VHPRNRCSQALSDRSYFCDVEGWVCKLLNEACAAGVRSLDEEEEAAGRETADGLTGTMATDGDDHDGHDEAGVGSGEAGGSGGGKGAGSSPEGAGGAAAAPRQERWRGSLPCEGDAVVQMRFLEYAEAGGGLPPHQDLSRTRRTDGVTSRCTFLLYLTDCDVGGETVLLQRLAQPSRVLASVTPRRGRLLLFPHACPHLAREVLAEGLPKLLLRGEII
jgi:hypothetical protein